MSFLEDASPQQAIAWRSYWLASAVFTVTCPFLWLWVVRNVLNAGLNLLWPVGVITALQMLTFGAFRPHTVEGRIAFGLAFLPLAGLVLTQLSISCCPGGHPTLGGVVWVLTSYASLACVLVFFILLALAARAAERSSFIISEVFCVLLTSVFACALVRV
jgi:hypothetical protein